MQNILEIKDLNVGFTISSELYQVVYNISLSLKKGEVLGIVGESGCGKSVTSMSIINLLPPNGQIISGEILYNGKNLLNCDKKEIQSIRGNKIAVIPQDPLTSLNPLYTIGNQIVEVIQLHQKKNKKEAEDIAVEMLEKVQIPDAANRLKDYPHQFSGGMRQRVLIAMALCCNPDILIADEPTTALDVTVQAQIMNLIKDILKKENKSMILITHDLGVIAELADQVAVLYSGKVVEQAEVKDLFNNPMHPYTKGLLNSVPTAKSEKLEPIEGQPPDIFEDIQGCNFNPRCKFVMDKCKTIDPVTKDIDNHTVKCHLYYE